jgi:histidine triad (HIT) family protein
MQKDPSCIFCKIAAGDIPCLKVYEDDSVLSFLDIGPLAEGHLLVIPKAHYVRLEDTPGDILAQLWRVLPLLAKAMLQVTGASAYNVLQNNGEVAGQEVQHVHFHLIPRFRGDGLGFRWNSKKYEGSRGAELQKQLTAALEA